MLGNTVNKYCPYFVEMGLTNVQKMEQGTIDVYQYGDSGLSVAVEYCKTNSDNRTKESKKYFAFNNPKLQMITGGAWELAIYPHLPKKYKPKDILIIYFIEFGDNLYQCEVINVDGDVFTYIHAKTTPIRKPNESIIYSLEHSPKMNYNSNIFKPVTKVQEKILWFFKNSKVFYQDNNIGDGINNFLKVCRNS